MLDLRPATDQVVRLLDGVTDSQLTRPTPCADTPVGAMLDHFMGLSLAFTLAARKTVPPGGSTPPRAAAEHLDPQWRKVLPTRLRELAEAWRDSAAWQGETEAGGLKMPAEVAGLVALDEVVLHGWDLAVATGQPYECDAASAAAVLEFASSTARPENAPMREGLFGPVVEVPDDASVFERALGFAGRDPRWTPPSD
jgi:uncharacterized protein (TIGR03086 family)